MLELKTEINCPICNGDKILISDIIAAFNIPLPDIFAIDCKKCGHTGSGYQDGKVWKIEWDENP